MAKPSVNAVTNHLYVIMQNIYTDLYEITCDFLHNWFNIKNFETSVANNGKDTQ